MSRDVFKAYSLFRRFVPNSLQEAMGRSALLKPLRDALLRPSDEMRLQQGEITWEDLTFAYQAPYRSFYKAREQGVENIICRLARATLQPGDSAVDVGANYGFVTTVMALSVAPAGHVYSFEIDPDVAAALTSTIRANDMGSVVHLTPKGAGPDVADGLVTVDSVVPFESSSVVRFLKIDTDGSDFGVLQGSIGLMKAHHPIVVIEMHQQAAEIYELLGEVGYTHFTDLQCQTVAPGMWPGNMIASTTPVTIPPKGWWRSGPA